MSSNIPITHDTLGEPRSTKSEVLNTGAGLTQDIGPVKNICAALNAFHVYASDPSRIVEANHYCSHVNEDFRQCLIYDSPERNARLIGVEYMITPRLYKTLPEEERKLWHSHVYEVKSGMLILPTPAAVPSAVWDIAEQKEMEDVIGLYGKTYHFWEVDKGDKLPMGQPKLMMSLTAEDAVNEKIKEAWADRDKRFRVDSAKKRSQREYIEKPEIHHDADSMWKK